MNNIRVLIVDDSPLMRKLLTQIIEKEEGLEVAGTARNGRIALDIIGRIDPDVVTMDVEMPVMNGLEALKQIMTENPRPVIIISSFTEAGAQMTFQSLELCAVDFITKPDSILSRQILDIQKEIILKIRTAANLKIRRRNEQEIRKIEEQEKKPVRLIPKKKDIRLGKCRNLVCIGISTGGPEALKNILPSIPPDIDAGFLIVQHMPIGFTRAFADRMNTLSQIEVKEAEEGDIILPGKALIARGDHHLTLRQERYAYVAMINQEKRVSLFRPSIDVLMHSAVEEFDGNKIAVLMTGMGFDGVEGMRRMKTGGAHTIVQDQETSVVYGMNKLAVQEGCIDQILPLNRIIPAVLDLIV